MSKTLRKLQTIQRNRKRCMLGFTRRDRKQNKWIREKTKIIDAISRVKKIKWNQAGDLARRNNNR